MDTPGIEGIQIHGERGDQGFSLAGAHFGDLALIEHHAADHLHIEMTHAKHPPARLAHDGEGLAEQCVAALTVGQALTKLIRLGRKGRVVECLQSRFQLIDLFDRFEHALHQPLVAAAEDLFHQLVEHQPSTFIKQEKQRPHDTPIGLCHGLGAMQKTRRSGSCVDLSRRAVV